MAWRDDPLSEVVAENVKCRRWLGAEDELSCGLSTERGR